MGFWQRIRSRLLGKDDSVEAEPVSAPVVEDKGEVVLPEMGDVAAEEEAIDDLRPLARFPLVVDWPPYGSPERRVDLRGVLPALFKQAEVIEESRHYMPGVVVLGVQLGLIMPMRGLALARHQPLPQQRVEALVGLIGTSVPVTEGTLIEEAVEAAMSIADLGERVRGLVMIPEQKAEAIRQAITIQDPEKRTRVLIGLEAWEEVMAAVAAIDSQWDMARCLMAMAPGLPPVYLAKAVELAQGLGESSKYQVEALCALVPYLSEDLREMLWEWLHGWTDVWGRVMVGGCLLGEMAADVREARLVWLRGLIDEAGYPNKVIEMWCQILRFLPEGEQAEVLAELQELAVGIERAAFRAEAMGLIALQMRGELRRKMLGEVCDMMSRVEVVGSRDYIVGGWGVALCGVDSGEVADVVKGLEIIGRVENEYGRIIHLEGVVPYLTVLSGESLVVLIGRLLPTLTVRAMFWERAAPFLGQEQLLAVADDVMEMSEQVARRLGLLALAPHLPKRQRAFLRVIIGEAKKRRTPASVPILLAALARYRPHEREALVERALEQVRVWDVANQAHILADMVAQLQDRVSEALLDEVEEAVVKVGTPFSRSIIWEGLLAHAAADRGVKWVKEALATLLQIEEGAHRRMRVAPLLPFLSEEEVMVLWQAVGTVIDDMDWPVLLELFVPYLPISVIGEVLVGLEALPAHRMQTVARGICILAPYLTAEQRDGTREIAAGIRFPAPRIKAQAALVALAEEPERSEGLKALLAEANEISIVSSRVNALTDMGRYLDGEERGEIVQAVLRLLPEAGDAKQRAYGLLGVVELGGEETAEVLVYAADEVEEERLRVQVLVKLIPQLAAPQVVALLPMVSKVGNVHEYAALLSELIGCLPVSGLPYGLALIRERAHEPVVVSCLKRFMPRWEEMATLPGVDGEVEMVVTLEAFAAGGLLQLLPVVTAFVPVMVASDEGEILLKQIGRLVK